MSAERTECVLSVMGKIYDNVENLRTNENLSANYIDKTKVLTDSFTHF